ncbi:GNAT family N-acetyltransferase [Bacillus massiliigorillae]|uniref:GNAT family N-acetyltransferase n=1 Tax=Bacillus massiliigorillae TaxID=1243664 RepID=UPI00039BAAD0|nr:GNAT family N-acetyltransferase [Bacillus massiliigorillae]
MLNVGIRRPKIDDIKQLNDFFKTVITDTFIKEGIGEKLNDINDEIETKKKYIESDFESNGEKRFFLIALNGDKIIGSIEYGPVSNLIKKCTNNAYKGLIEVGTVFVHPDSQRNGVGNLLLKAIYDILQKNKIEEFCLDSGYNSAQRIWKKKFGDPNYLFKDYWGYGNDHMIWRIKISDCITE